jgi:hypothetical protein
VNGDGDGRVLAESFFVVVSIIIFCSTGSESSLFQSCPKQALPNRANAAFAANSLIDKLSLCDSAALPTLIRLSTIFDPLSNGRFFGMLLVYPEL